MNKTKVLTVVGPTAAGKTSFGIRCAGLFNGEIISGDSIQVYRGLDIGSAKVSKTEQAQARHHLIDILDPQEDYNVKSFQELSRELIAQISSQGKLPIIVGGTGLYIKACLYDYVFPSEEGEDDLHEELTNQQLYDLLKEKDPQALQKIHVNNRRRLLRAYNVYEKQHIPFSQIKASQQHELIYDSLIVGLTMPREELYRRIDERVDLMIKEGLIQEIQSLLERGISFSDKCMQGIGYKEFQPYFEKQMSLEDCISKVKSHSRQFAKRQYTFFKNQFPVQWYEDQEEAMKEVERWSI